MEFIHLKIKKIRINNNFTQKYMAKKLGFKSTSAYCKIESGETDITLKKLQKISNLLKVSLKELLFFENTSTIESNAITQNLREDSDFSVCVEILTRLKDIENNLRDIKNKM